MTVQRTKNFKLNITVFLQWVKDMIFINTMSKMKIKENNKVEW